MGVHTAATNRDRRNPSFHRGRTPGGPSARLACRRCAGAGPTGSCGRDFSPDCSQARRSAPCFSNRCPASDTDHGPPQRAAACTIVTAKTYADGSACRSSTAALVPALQALVGGTSVPTAARPGDSTPCSFTRCLAPAADHSPPRHAAACPPRHCQDLRRWQRSPSSTAAWCRPHKLLWEGLQSRLQPGPAIPAAVLFQPLPRVGCRSRATATRRNQHLVIAKAYADAAHAGAALSPTTAAYDQSTRAMTCPGIDPPGHRGDPCRNLVGERSA